MVLCVVLLCFGSASAFQQYRAAPKPCLRRAHILDDGLATAVLSEEALRFLQVATPVASQVLFLSPLGVIDEFQKEGTRDASALPYAAMVANGAAWCAYALLVDPADLTIFAANAGGVFFGLYYCWTFHRHMSDESDGPRLFAGALAVCVLLATAGAFLPAATAHALTGYAAVGFCVLMFGGPLASGHAILRTCSAAALPLGFTLATVLNCALWWAYGFAIHDPLVWGPNVAGLVASAAQLGLYAKYGDNQEGCGLFAEGCLLPDV